MNHDSHNITAEAETSSGTKIMIADSDSKKHSSHAGHGSLRWLEYCRDTRTIRQSHRDHSASRVFRYIYFAGVKLRNFYNSEIVSVC